MSGDFTLAEQTHLQIAKALSRLDYGAAHGLPWSSAARLEVPRRVLEALTALGYVQRRPVRRLPSGAEYRITPDGAAFYAQVKRIAVDGLVDVVLTMTQEREA